MTLGEGLKYTTHSTLEILLLRPFDSAQGERNTRPLGKMDIRSAKGEPSRSRCSTFRSARFLPDRGRDD